MKKFLLSLSCLILFGLTLNAEDSLADKTAKAIEQSLTFLISQQQKDGSFAPKTVTKGAAKGHTILCCYSLITAKIDPKRTELVDKTAQSIEKALKYIKKHHSKSKGFDSADETYSISLLMMSLEALVVLQDDDIHSRYNHVKKIKFKKNHGKRWMLALYMKLLKNISFYSVDKVPGITKKFKSKKKFELIGFGYNEKDKSIGLSRTQYAALALASAYRMGVKIHSQLVMGIFNYVLYTQQVDGELRQRFLLKDKRALKKPQHRFEEIYGFGVNATDSISFEAIKDLKDAARGWDYGGHESLAKLPTVTAANKARCSDSSAAIVSLLACQVMIKQDKKLKTAYEVVTRKAIFDGLAYLDKNFSVKANNRAGQWKAYGHFNLFNLYAMERVGSMSGIENFGKNLWFQKGCQHLVESQNKNGSWGSAKPLQETCFALLFLNRPTKKVPFKGVYKIGGSK